MPKPEVKRHAIPSATPNDIVQSVPDEISDRRSRHPASTFWRRISTSRQVHQVGRFFGVSEEFLARRAHLRTHGQTARQVEDLARARGYRKVRRYFPRADRVAEPAFHQRHAASDGILQELPDLSVVYEGRDAYQKTSWG